MYIIKAAIPVDPELLAASTVISMLQSCDGHKLVYRGLEELAQRQNVQASSGAIAGFTTKEFRTAVGILEEYDIVSIRPEHGVGMACLNLQPHHPTIVSLVFMNILLTDFITCPCRWRDEVRTLRSQNWTIEIRSDVIFPLHGYVYTGGCPSVKGITSWSKKDGR